VAGDTLVSARRALDAGLSANAGGRPGRAAASFRAALRVLDRAEPPGRSGAMAVSGAGTSGGGEPDWIRARALLGLVMSDFELRADLPAAHALLDDAERLAVRAGADATKVAVRGQRGLLLLRAGETTAALREHDRAAAGLEQADPVDACCILLNRGTLHLELGHVPAARADLAACVERAVALGDAQLEFKARHNLGYAEFLAGDLPRALATMAEAAAETGGVSLAVAHLDRAQVLLEAGLVTEADATLARAAELFRDQRLSFDLAQVELARSRCAVLLGSPTDALRLARAAQRRFRRRGNAPWGARAAQAELRARLDAAVAAGVSHRPTLLAVARDAAALRSAADPATRDLGPALRALEAQALVAAGRHAAAAAAAGRLTGGEPLGVAVALRGVKAEIAFAVGRPAVARRHVAAGQALLAAQRRQLGSVEAVTAAAVHGTARTRVAVADAVRRRDAPGLLAAVEAGRATFAGPARVRPPADDHLAALLAELRVAAERERLLPPDAPADERAQCRQETARVRTAARERAWELGEGAEAPQAAPLAQVQDALVDGAVADYIVHAGSLHTVLVRAGGVELHTLAAAADVEAVLRRVDADLLALAGPVLPGALRDVVRGSLARGLRRLDELLVRPLGHDGPLHVVAGSGLVTLPWGLVPSRVGRATSVATRLALDGAALRRAGAVAVAGPDLEHAHEEALAVAETWSGSVLAGASATAGAAAGALRTAGVVHLAAHGRHEPENPLFSWVRLADGPLFAHELEGADLGGSLVVLSSCEVGRASVRPGGEVLGMASVLLRLGAGTVVAALAPIRDDLAARVMPQLHRLLAAGVPAPTALATVAADAGEPVPLACFAGSLPTGATPA
jgi:tetratricopeptide (TPR) repeat protein